MKNLFFLFLFAVFISSSAYSQWEQIGSPKSGIAICFAKTDTSLFIGTETGNSGLYVSYDKGEHWLPKNILPRVCSIFLGDTFMLASVANKGVYKSIDEGDSWYLVKDSMTVTDEFLLYHDTIIAATQGGLACSGICYSVDDGENWINANGLYSPVHPYNNLTRIGSTIFASRNFDGIYTSEDAGANWSKLITSPATNTVYIKSISNCLITLVDTNMLYVSYDLGANWLLINTGSILGNHFTKIAVDEPYIYVGTKYNGIYRTADLGTTWTEINNGLYQDYIVSLFADSNEVYAGSFGGVSRSLDFGDNWNMINNNMPYWDAAYIEVVDSCIYALSLCQGLLKTTNDGDTWEHLYIGIDSLYERMLPDVYPASSHTKGYDYTVFDSGLVVVFPRRGIYFSNDDGQNWEARNHGLTPLGVELICASDSVLFVTTYDEGIYRSVDFGLNWIPANNGLPSNFDILPYITATDSFVLVSCSQYLSSPPYQLSHLYLSSDKGQTWNLLTTSTPSDIKFSKPVMKDSVIIIPTIVGVDISTDYGNTWTLYDAGIPNKIGQSGLDICCVGTNGVDFFMGSGGHGIFKLFNDTWVPVNTGYDSLLNNPNKIHHQVTKIEATQSDVYFATGNSYTSEYAGIWKRSLDDLSINEFKGNVFNDLNNNGNRDLGENGVVNIIINTQKTTGYYTTDSLGNYVAFTEYNSDSLFARRNSQYIRSINPISYYVSAPDTGLDFAIHYIPNVQDLRIILTNFGARPGLLTSTYMTYKNEGTDTMSGIVKLIYDSDLVYISSTLAPSSIVNDTLMWSFSNMHPQDFKDIKLDFYVPLSVNVFEILEFEAYIYPIVTDTTPANNYDFLNIEVTNSYDPNDKKVSPKEGLTLEQLKNNKKLAYTIRFQNTGTDTALNVRIVDTLEQELNVLSFNMLSASHPYRYSIKGRGYVEFYFDNIMLPDSNVNESASHGFVKFEIEADKSLEIGDSILNKAYIYFDFNPPVLTNTTNTKILDTLSFDSDKDELISNVFPNPTKETINIYLNTNEECNINIIDIMGRLLYSHNFSNYEISIDVSTLQAGLYFIVAHVEHKSFCVKKFIKY